MPIPDFQTIMLPLLRFMEDGNEHSTHETVDALAKIFDLTEQELNELLPSGKQTTFYNRIVWARTYLFKSGLLEMSRRSFYRITNRGREALKSNPPRIDIRFLRQFPEFIDFREGRQDVQVAPTEPTKVIEERTPEEALEDAYQEIRDSLAQEVIAQVKSCSPAFFERLVVELLVKMG